MPTIRLERVTKIYRGQERAHVAVKEISLKVCQGEFVFVIGKRGAGKSTLLKLISGVIQPELGAVYLDQLDLAQVSGRNRQRIQQTFGCVWQESELKCKRTVAENLKTTAKAGWHNVRSTGLYIDKVLGLLGLRGVEDLYPAALSYSQYRKVQLAGALINSPSILILDELTENLDEDSIWDMMYLLNEVNRQGTTVIMATHAEKIVNIMCRRVITIREGRILGDMQKGRYGDIL